MSKCQKNENNVLSLPLSLHQVSKTIHHNHLMVRMGLKF